MFSDVGQRYMLFSCNPASFRKRHEKYAFMANHRYCAFIELFGLM